MQEDTAPFGPQESAMSQLFRSGANTSSGCCWPASCSRRLAPGRRSRDLAALLQRRASFQPAPRWRCGSEHGKRRTPLRSKPAQRKSSNAHSGNADRGSAKRACICRLARHGPATKTRAQPPTPRPTPRARPGVVRQQPFLLPGGSEEASAPPGRGVRLTGRHRRRLRFPGSRDRVEVARASAEDPLRMGSRRAAPPRSRRYRRTGSVWV